MHLIGSYHVFPLIQWNCLFGCTFINRTYLCLIVLTICSSFITSTIVEEGHKNWNFKQLAANEHISVFVYFCVSFNPLKWERYGSFYIFGNNSHVT